MTVAQPVTAPIFSASGSLTFGPQIVNVGRWIINPSFHIYTTKRPCWLHRVMSHLLLGWKWEDETMKGNK